MKAKKIIFLNQKGGVGKTTSAVNLGSILAEGGKKVLLIDLDSQGNLSSSIGCDAKLKGAYELLNDGFSVDLIQKSKIKNLFCITGSYDLAGISIETANNIDRNLLLKNNTIELDMNYDFILLDCPPELGVLTMNALAWTQWVFIPMQCEYLAMEGLNIIFRTIANVKTGLNPDIKILGICFCMYTKRNRLSKEVVNSVTKYFGKYVLKTLIPRNVRLAEAPSHGLPINKYDNSCAGGKAYRKLAKEITRRVK